MVSKRIGKWSWALSPEERLAATVVERAQSEKAHVTLAMRRRYVAMLEKQKKLGAREAPAAPPRFSMQRG